MEIDKESTRQTSIESTRLKRMNSINTQYMLDDTVVGFSPDEEAEIIKEYQSTNKSFTSDIFDMDMQNSTNFLIAKEMQENYNTTKDSNDQQNFDKSKTNASASSFLKMIKSAKDMKAATLGKTSTSQKSSDKREKRLNTRNLITKNICNKRKGNSKGCKKCASVLRAEKGRTNPRMHVMMEDLSLVLAVKLHMMDS